MGAVLWSLPLQSQRLSCAAVTTSTRLGAVLLTRLYSRPPSIGNLHLQHFFTKDANITEEEPRPHSTTSPILSCRPTPRAHPRGTLTLCQFHSPTVFPPGSKDANQLEHSVCRAQCHLPTTAHVSGRDWPARNAIGRIVLVFSQTGAARLLVGACA